MLKVWNLTNQFLIALFTAWIVCLLARRLGVPDYSAVVWSLTPVVILLFAPASLYHFLVNAFPDQSVLLPFVFLVLLEVLRDGTQEARRKAVLDSLQALVGFYGMLTDYLFPFLLAFVYLKRLADIPRNRLFSPSTLRQTVLFWLPALVAVVLFLGQIWAQGGMDELHQRLLLRTGMNREDPWSFTPIAHFWERHVLRGFGWTGIVLIVLSLIFCLAAGAIVGVKRLRGRGSPSGTASIMMYASLFTLPCFLHALFLRNHCGHPLHYFTALKFVLPLATVPFCLAPLAALRFLYPGGYRGLPRRSAIRLVPFVMLAFAIGYVVLEWPRVAPQFRPDVSDPVKMAVAEFIGENTTYEDVLFTWNSGLEQNDSPLYLAFSMKRVYPALTLQQISDKLAPIDGDYVVNIIAKRDEPLPERSNLAPLMARATEILRSGHVRIMRIPKKAFLETCREAGVSTPTRS